MVKILENTIFLPEKRKMKGIKGQIKNRLINRAE